MNSFDKTHVTIDMFVCCLLLQEYVLRGVYKCITFVFCERL